MTKQARYSSSTGWHRDSRYWHFQRPELISVWLALRDERIGEWCRCVAGFRIAGRSNRNSSIARSAGALILGCNQSLLAQARPCHYH